MLRTITTATLAAAAAGSIALGVAGTATAGAHPGCTIDVPVKVRLEAGCFLPTSEPALEPGDATWTPPAEGMEPVPFSLPVIPAPEAEETPAEEAPSEDAGAE